MTDPQRILVLEDDPNRQLQFKDRFIEKSESGTKIQYTIVESAKDCISLLEASEWNLVILDHDLGGEVFVESLRPNTGGEVARWIENNVDKMLGNPYFVIHSLNGAGAEYMENTIKQVTDRVCRIPFVWSPERFSRINM